MSTTTPARSAIRPGDVTITLLLLAVFVYGWVEASAWPYRAALVPRIVTAIGTGLCLLKIGQLVVSSVRGRDDIDAVEDVSQGEGPQIIDEDEGDEQSLEYIFAIAGPRAWVVALGWIAAFFVGLRLVGLFWVTPIVTVLYLRITGKTSLLAAVAYAAIAEGVLYLAFRELLHVPYPRGIF